MKIGVAQAILWGTGVHFVFVLSLPFAAALAPRLPHDYTMLAALLALFYFAGCALFAARRPGRTWSETFALRKTSPWLVLLAIALGVATCLPANVLTEWVVRLIPYGKAELDAHAELIEPRTFAELVACFAFVAGIGPFAEELLFRGALYTGLRPNHGALSAGASTMILFTIFHEPRFWPALIVVAGLITLARAVSGSIWPGLFLHVAFNATSLAMSPDHPLVKELGLALVVACSIASLLLTGVLGWVGRASASADRARQVDLEADPGLGETQS